MRKEDINLDTSKLAFDFFYWFSRFEYALKDNNYLKSHKVGEIAIPGWDQFIRTWEETYTISKEGEELLSSAPKIQVVMHDGQLEWISVKMAHQTSDLGKVIKLLKTVRNNLFHGGKHGAEDWDNPDQMIKLLIIGKSVLDQLAELGQLQADYTRYY